MLIHPYLPARGQVSGAAPSVPVHPEVGTTADGPPCSTHLSTKRPCQPEKTENSKAETWAAASTLGVRVGPQPPSSQNGENVRAK